MKHRIALKTAVLMCVCLFLFTAQAGPALAVPFHGTGTGTGIMPWGSGASLNIGDIVTFGHYEQDNRSGNGEEAIEWKVLETDEQNGRVLLLSLYGLDVQPYDTNYTTYKLTTWESCTLRKWLNSTFLNAAFSSDEQSALITSYHGDDDASSSVYLRTSPEGDRRARDQVFLLSYHDADVLYFYEEKPYAPTYGFLQKSDAQRRCGVTEYAVSRGALTSNEHDVNGRPTGHWWLRTPRTLSGRTYDGFVVRSGGDVDIAGLKSRYLVVRPAIWVKMSALNRSGNGGHTAPEPVTPEPGIVERGSCGSGVYWKLHQNGTLTVYGSGKMEFSSDDAPWEPYSSDIESIVIDYGVENIAPSAFSQHENADSVSIADSVTRIGDFAFTNCYQINSVTLPDSLTYIGIWAFAGCKISKFYIPSRVAEIGKLALWTNDDLTRIDVDPANPYFCSESGVLYNKAKTILIQVPRAYKGNFQVPSGVTSIASFAFDGCTLLTGVSLPGSLREIGVYAFTSCENLESLTLPARLTTINEGAFVMCRKLTSIRIPSSVTYIGDYPFTACDSLQEIHVASGNRSYVSMDGVLYNRAMTDLIAACTAFSGHCIIPEGVTTIHEEAFSGCDRLTAVSIPASVTKVDQNAFSSCYRLKTVYYGGSRDQWNRIQFEVTEKDLQNADIRYGRYPD